METLQVITLAFVGFVWVEIRNLRDLLSEARETISDLRARLHRVEKLEEARSAKGSQ